MSGSLDALHAERRRQLDEAMRGGRWHAGADDDPAEGGAHDVHPEPRALERRDLLRCDYDPFHCVLHFENQKLHIATLIDEPVVLVWADREEVVDFKTDKQDSLLHRGDRLFGVRHPDRGKVLDFFAGSGTTGAACLELGRTFILVDNNPQAIEVMQKRFADVPEIEWVNF